MIPQPPRPAGRPRASSRQLIEDAAAELFVESGYAATTIDAISQRAGTSRATFFNYFEAKSDLLWLDVDAAIAQLSETDDRGLPALRAALRRAALGMSVPLVLTQSELVGSEAEVTASGLVRVAALASAVDRFLDDRLAAGVVAAAVAEAWLGWARAGVARGALGEWIATNLDRVERGLRD
jgi:AcrR family transcriptional regulator